MSANSSEPGGGPVIRPLTIDDLPEVSRLAGAAPEDDNSYPVEQLEREMAGTSEKPPPEGRVVFGCFEGGGLAAVGCANVEEDSTGYVSRVYTAPSFRGRGIGKRLVGAIESHLKERGCRKAYLYCWGPNVASQRFWVAVGYYRIAAIGHTHDGVLGHVVKCEKILDR